MFKYHLALYPRIKCSDGFHIPFPLSSCIFKHQEKPRVSCLSQLQSLSSSQLGKLCLLISRQVRIFGFTASSLLLLKQGEGAHLHSPYTTRHKFVGVACREKTIPRIEVFSSYCILYMRAQVSSSQLVALFAPRYRLARSGDIFVCQNSEWGKCYWHYLATEHL